VHGFQDEALIEFHSRGPPRALASSFKKAEIPEGNKLHLTYQFHFTPLQYIAACSQTLWPHIVYTIIWDINQCKT